MALSKIDVANMLTGATPVANGGTGLTSGTTNQFLKFTGSTTLASAADNAGITGADQWRLSSSVTGQQEPLSSNLERVDTDGFGKIGTGLSVSSGIFSFPDTGYWLVMGNVYFSKDGAQRKVGFEVQSTTDNSSYSVAAEGFTHQSDESSGEPTLSSAQASFIFDVTSTSTHKVKFNMNVNNDGSITIGGSTDANLTYFTFIRLGDT